MASADSSLLLDEPRFRQLLTVILYRTDLIR